jgi:hypothetical protein
MLRKIFQHSVHHNLVISFSGAMLSYGITHHFGLKHQIHYVLLTFLLSYGAYNLQRIIDHTSFETAELAKTWKNNQIKIIFSTLALTTALFLGVYLFNIRLLLFIFTFLFSVISSWYTFPVFGKKLREIPYLKIFAIATTWAFTTTFFPLYNEGKDFVESSTVSLLIAIYFIAITLPFDIRDMHADDQKQQTIPQIVGIVKSKIIGTILLVLFFIGSIDLALFTLFNSLFLLAIILQIVLLVNSSEQKSINYFNLIDASILMLSFSFLLS